MEERARTKFVAIGGGTGLSTLLRGLASHQERFSLSAIVTVSDDGYSSGRLREEFGTPPPGDIRNCLVALADPDRPLTRLFAHRFPGTGELGGHSLGNLLLLGLSQLDGDLLRAIEEARQLLGVTARVLPASLTPIDLVAEVAGEIVTGQVAIKSRQQPISRLSITPPNAQALDEAVEAILAADVITLGPGSLYSSVIANLLIDGIREALIRSTALKVYICNVMSEGDETTGLDAEAHVSEVLRYGRGLSLDYAVFNSSPISAEMRERYAAENAIALPPPRPSARGTRPRMICLPLASEEGFVRHDPARLSEAIFDLYNA